VLPASRHRPRPNHSQTDPVLELSTTEGWKAEWTWVVDYNKTSQSYGFLVSDVLSFWRQWSQKSTKMSSEEVGVGL